jgi:hypothetical protein
VPGAYTISDETMEQVIQALDNSAVSLSLYICGGEPDDPQDARSEAQTAYDTLTAIVAEHVSLED